MLNKRTVFVVGAGGSFDLGFPLGGELIKSIATRLNVDPQAPSSPGDLHFFSKTQHQYPPARLHIAHETLTRMHLRLVDYDSIDDFLDFYQGDENVVSTGKAAIVQEILSREEASPLARVKTERGFRFDGIANSWHLQFFNLLRKGLRREDLGQIFNNAAVICFNYDRCIEYFLYAALIHFGELSDDEAKQVMLTLQVHHPYGSLGPIFDEEHLSQRVIPFGTRDDSPYNLAKWIKTYTQSVESHLRSEIRNTMTWAQQVVFLGFGFHKQNMVLLDTGVQLGVPIFATTYQVSDPARRAITANISQHITGSGGLDLPNLNCRDFFEQYAQLLAT